MAPRLPVETRRNEETGNNEARCRNQCRQWKEFCQFAPCQIENHSFNCRQCMASSNKKWRREILPKQTISQAEHLWRSVKSRENSRKIRMEMKLCDVRKLVETYGGRCVMSGTDEDLRIARIVQNKPLTLDNAVIVTRKIENLVYKKDPLWGRIFENAIPKLQILNA